MNQIELKQRPLEVSDLPEKPLLPMAADTGTPDQNSYYELEVKTAAGFEPIKILTDWDNIINKPALDATANTLPEGSKATAEVNDSTDPIMFTFGIPKGDRGEAGVIVSETEPANKNVVWIQPLGTVADTVDQVEYNNLKKQVTTLEKRIAELEKTQQV